MLAIAAMGESSAAEAEAGAVLKHRMPTPDHPPYSWMIGQAIAALGEGGGSAEDAISGFIRARHPGVPAVHDRFLRHYLAKHVAEGLFVCTAPGRYSCRADDDDEPVLALEEGRATEAKRGRGRPRKDGSAPTPTPASDKKVGSESRSTTPKRRGRPRKDGSLAAPPPVAASAASRATEGKRRPGRPRKDGSPAAPPPIAASAASPATEGKRRPGRPRKDGSPAAPPPVAASAASPATEGKRGPGRPPKDVSSPAARKKGGSGSPSATPKRRGRPRVLPLNALIDVSGKALVTDMKDGSDAPSATDNNHGEPREPALVVVNDGSTAPSVTVDDGPEAPSAKLPLVAKEPATFTTPEHSTEPCKLAFVAAEEDSALSLDADKEDGTQAPFEGSAPPLDTDKEDDGAPFENSAPPLVPGKAEGTQTPFKGSAPELVADKEEGTQTPFEGSASALATDKEDGAQTPFKGCAPELVADKDDTTPTPFESSAPEPAADKDDFTEPAFTKHKRGRRTCRSVPVKATRPAAKNKAGCKAASAPPKGRGRQCKPASAAAGELRPRRPAPKPRKMFLLNADKVVPENRMFCVLALPAPVPAATKV